MRPLPRETTYLPFEAGPYRMAMGLRTVPETEWFEIDDRYGADMAERNRLLAERRPDVFGASPCSEPARMEVLTMVVEHLARVHPDWFATDGAKIENQLTGERSDISAHDALELAGRLVQEDLCLIEASPEGPRLTAAILCFPSQWRLHEKLGRPLAEVHHNVPLYADRLARPVDRFMDQVRPGHIASRLNWSVGADPALFQPFGKWRTEIDATITQQNAGQRLFLRVERQTLRRLPASGAVLFGIRVHVYSMSLAIDSPDKAAAFASAVRALPAEMARYKSLPMFRDALLAWLDWRAA